MRKALLPLLICAFVCVVQVGAQAAGPTINWATATPLVLPGDSVHVTANVTWGAGSAAGVTANGSYLTYTGNGNWEGDIAARAELGVYSVDVIATDLEGYTDEIADAASYRVTTVLGSTMRQLLDPAAAGIGAKHIVRVWGRAKFLDADRFSVTDGSTYSVIAVSPEHDVADDDIVEVQGILDTTNAPPAVLMNASYTILQLGPRKEITIYNANVGKDLQVTNYGYLPSAVPWGGSLKVTITSTDPSKVLLSKDADTPGGETIAQIVEGGSSSIPTFYIQGLASSGSVDVIASAPGGLGKTFKVNLYPSGFGITSGSFSTTAYSDNRNIQIRPARLNSTDMRVAEWGTLRAGMPNMSVAVSSSDPQVGVITDSPVTIGANGQSATTQFDPLTAGASDISIDTPAGFSTPGSHQVITATIRQPVINAYNLRVGRDLLTSSYCYLEARPPSPVDVTISVADESVATVSFYAGDAGSKSVTYTSIQSTNALTFWVQGRTVGSTTLTISAPGYGSATQTMDVDPSGFGFTSGNFSTTSFAANRNVSVRPARLDPTTLRVTEWGKFRSGIADVLVPVTSSDVSVGVIVTSPLVFQGLSDTVTAQFDPINAGTAVLSVETPAGFETPSDKQSITATITAPDVMGYDVRVGRDLTTSSYCYLETAPPVSTAVTIEVADESVATVSFYNYDEGARSITFPGIQSTGAMTFWVQGRTVGTTTLTVTAQGFNPLTKTITVDPSGFGIVSGSFSTTYYSSNRSITVRPARLNPDTLTVAEWGQLRSGLPNIEVPVVSSDTAVGTITDSPLVFLGNVYDRNTNFDPASAGTAEISITNPAEFDTPSDRQSITATVEVPEVIGYDVRVGRDLTTSTYCYLEVVPPSPVDVIIEVGDQSVATISNYAGEVGSKTLTRSNIQSASAINFWVQGRGLGTTTLTVTANGYSTCTRTITVDPSGFAVSTPGDFSIAATSTGKVIVVRPARLDPETFLIAEWGKLRYGISDVNVEVLSSNWDVGTIATSPITYVGLSDTNSTLFVPADEGTCTISVVPPAGFSTPNRNREITATVTP